MFHFNKKHLEDPTIPMWVIKTKGESYYVEHVECNIPWSTKETPDNNHTKGSLKIKRCHLVIDDDNTAHLNELTPEIEARLNKPDTVIRVITRDGKSFRETLESVENVGIKIFGGGCGTAWYVTEFNSEEQYVLFKLMMPSDSDWRELKPNEDYYKLYEKHKNSANEHVYDEYDDDDDDLYEDEEGLLPVKSDWSTLYEN